MKKQTLGDLGYDFVSYIGLNVKPRRWESPVYPWKQNSDCRSASR